MIAVIVVSALVLGFSVAELLRLRREYASLPRPKKREHVPEPWMLGIEATVNGQSLQPYVPRRTLTGRIRHAFRRVLGLPEFRGIQISDGAVTDEDET